MPAIAQSRLPRFADAVYDLARARRVGRGHTYRDRPEAIYKHAMMYGSFDQMRFSHSWPEPEPRRCPICRRQFAPETLSPWMLTQFGPPRYCPACCCRARNGAQLDLIEDRTEAIRRLSSALSSVPSATFSTTIISGIAEQDRDAVMVALITTPPAADLKKELGGTWLRALQAAGLVGEAWRPSRGTYCEALDGHSCRSLAEKTVDDFLSGERIAHSVEPYWPAHPQLNSEGSKRADWKLDDGTLVEFAGMMGEAAYRSKIRDKQRLADELGIGLLVLLPEDLPNLAAAFRPWLRRG